MSYVRFVIASNDSRSQVRQGVFQAVFDLDDGGHLSAVESAHLLELGLWFDKNLPTPSRFSSRLDRSRRNGRAITWFKDSAYEHLERVREIVEILRNHDVGVEVITTDRPGYVVYEDEWQLAAEPFRDTGA
jgi:hypothetical protein